MYSNSEMSGLNGSIASNEVNSSLPILAVTSLQDLHTIARSPQSTSLPASNLFNPVLLVETQEYSTTGALQVPPVNPSLHSDAVTGLPNQSALVSAHVFDVQKGSLHVDPRFETGQAGNLEQATEPHTHLIDVEQPIPSTVGNANIVLKQPLIGIIDTGFKDGNPDVDGSRLTLGQDWVSGDANPLLAPGEGDEHGTQILNLIAATQNNGIGIDGINDQAPIWLSRAVGSGRWQDALIEFVDSAKASNQQNAIVNLSFELTQVNPDGSVTTRYQLTETELKALQYAQQNGVLLVVAAGNDGSAMSALAQTAQAFDNILTVGAAEGEARANYSSYGAGLGLLAPGSLPGQAIEFIRGTSVATAQVTGAASQVWAANPQLHYRQVIDILKATAIDLNEAGWDAQTGAGLLNLKDALALAELTEPQADTLFAWSALGASSSTGQWVPMERAASSSNSGINFREQFYDDFRREFSPFPQDYTGASGGGYGGGGYGGGSNGGSGYGGNGYGGSGYGGDDSGGGSGDSGGDGTGYVPPIAVSAGYLQYWGTEHGSRHGERYREAFIDGGWEYFQRYWGLSFDRNHLAWAGSPLVYRWAFELFDRKDWDFWRSLSASNYYAPEELRPVYWNAYWGSWRAAFPEWNTREAPTPPPPSPTPGLGGNDGGDPADYMERLRFVLDVAASELPDRSAESAGSWEAGRADFISGILTPQFAQYRQAFLDLGEIIDRHSLHAQMGRLEGAVTNLYNYVEVLKEQEALLYTGEQFSHNLASLYSSNFSQSVPSALLPAKLMIAAALTPEMAPWLTNNSSEQQWNTWGNLAYALQGVYARRTLGVNTAPLPGTSGFFLETLWQANDETALERAGAELWSVLQSTGSPEVMLRFTAHLLGTASHFINSLLPPNVTSPEAARYDSEFLAEYLLLAKAYATLNPPIAESGGASFLDTSWSAATQNSYSNSGWQLQEFLDGVTRPAHALRFTRSILETVQQADIPAELKRDRRFLHELIMLAQGYAVINPTDVSAEDSQFFLHTLWNAQDNAALAKATGELETLIEGIENPAEVVTYIRRLIKAANHTPELEAVRRDSVFLSELVNLGKTYGAIDPVQSYNSEPLNSFLHTIWTAQSETDIQRGVAQLNQAIEETKAVVSAAQFVEFINNLITAADSASDNLGQTQDAAFYAALTSLGQAYAVLNPVAHPDGAESISFFLDSAWKQGAWKESPLKVANELQEFFRDVVDPTRLMKFSKDLIEAVSAVGHPLQAELVSPLFVQELLEMSKSYAQLTNLSSSTMGDINEITGNTLGGWSELIRREYIAGPNISSGLSPWSSRPDLYDEFQRTWALALVADYAPYIKSVAEHYNITPDAIAGAILWEALENPYPRLRGLGPLAFTRPGATRSAFGIPGKIHVDNDDIAARFDSVVAARMSNWNPRPPARLLNVSVEGFDLRGLGAVIINRRVDRLLYDPRVSIEYIGAILNSHASDYEIVGAEFRRQDIAEDRAVREVYSIRDMAGILGALYQGGDSLERARRFEERRTVLLNDNDPENDRNAVPSLPRDELMGPWISQYRWWINLLLSANGGSSNNFSGSGDIPIPAEYDQRSYGNIRPSWQIWP